MADRQGFENNDFSGGLSDEYVPAKDNRLDAAENICLDDDLTPIQRPGSAPLGGSNATYGIHLNQKNDPIKGLIENSKDLYAFTNSRAFSYNKTTLLAFSLDAPDSGTPSAPVLDAPNFNTAHTFVGGDPITITPTLDASINHYQMRDIVYATSSDGSYVQKFFTEDTKGKLAFGVGLPIPPNQFVANSSFFRPIVGNEVSLWRRYFTYPLLGGPSQAIANATPKLYPKNATAPLVLGVPRPDDYYGWSDKPYTYHNGVAIKGGGAVPQWAFKYQLCHVLKITYKVDGVTYIKRSAPTVPTWFLSDIELKSTTTGTPPTSGSFTEYYLGITYSLTDINNWIRGMNLPFMEEGFFEIETYMTDNNGSTFTTRKYYIARDLPFQANPPVDIAAFYSRVNHNTGPSPIAVPPNYVPPADVTNDEQYQPDMFVIHGRDVADTDFNSLYTQGGVLPNDPPPPAKYIFNSGVYSFYLNIRELAITNIPAGLGVPATYTYSDVPYRLKISNANDPDSVPEGNIVDLPDPLAGGGAVLDRAIVGTTKEIYRIDGRYNPDGSGLVNGQLLSSETGLLSHKSVVSVKDKLFFAGDDGIYMTDGVGVICISRHLSRTYRRLVMAVASDSTGDFISIDRTLAQKNISAVYDRVYDRVIFSFGKYSLALELKASRLEEGYGAFFGEWFLGVNKALTYDGFSALGIYKDLVVRGDSFGYVYQMSPGYLSDPISSDATLPPVTGLLPIIYRLRTAKMALGSLVVKKWVSLVTFVLKRRKVLQGGQTDVDVQVNAYNDGERVRQALKPAHYSGQRDNVFDENPMSGGNAVPKDITDTLVNFQRRFGSSGLRCLTKAVEFTNGLHLVGKSDDFEQSLGSGVFVSLPNFPTYQWPKAVQDTNQNGYLIAFEADNYQTKYFVNSSTPSTLTLLSAPPAGLQKWKLYSFSTKQFFGLHSLGLVYSTFGSKHSDYQLSQQGGNSGDAGE